MPSLREFIFGKKDNTIISGRIGSIENTVLNGGFAVNRIPELIYKGEHPAFTLSAGTYNRQITTAARLVGCPIIQDDEHESLQKLIQDEYQIIVIQSLVNGTHWVLPQDNGSLLHIKDYIVGSDGLRIDPVTQKLVGIVTNENITWYTGETFSTVNSANKQTIYKEGEIVEIWRGQINQVSRLTSKGLPIPFPFNSLGDYRGVSAYSGVIELLRDIHAVRANRDNILATIRHIPVIKTKDFDSFVKTNLLANAQATREEIENADEKGLPLPPYKPLEAKVVLLDGNDETATYTMLPPPTGLAGEHGQALEDLIREQITSSPLPELLSGKMTTGNYASVEAHVELTIDFIRSLRREYTKPTDALLQRCAAQDVYGNGGRVEWTWDNVELTSAQTRAATLSAWISALNTLQTGNIPPEIAFDALKGINPAMPYKDAAELKEALRAAKDEAGYEVGKTELGLF